jgi:hypothetical protein
MRPQRLHGLLRADLAAQLEAIGDALGRRVDADLGVVADVLLDAVGIGPSGGGGVAVGHCLPERNGRRVR